MNDISDHRPSSDSPPGDDGERRGASGIRLPRMNETEAEIAARRERERLWKIENREAIEAYNGWVEENGLPLAEFRPS